MKAQRVHLVAIGIFPMNKSDSTIVFLLIIAVQLSEWVSVSQMVSSSEKVERKPQTLGKTARALRWALCLSGFAYVFRPKHNEMINASGIQLVEERLNHFSLPSVKMSTATVTFIIKLHKYCTLNTWKRMTWCRFNGLS